ncbi:MAG: GIY-YIG nuclease family protein, partial [Pirellulales bacterium]
MVEGTPNGVLTAEISNWTGKLVVCPRWQLEKLARREEPTRTGVYTLVGPDPDSTHRERVYIGESENIFERLKQHHK